MTDAGFSQPDVTPARSQAISALPQAAFVNRLCCCRWTLPSQPPPTVESAVIPTIFCPAQAPPGRLRPAGLRPARRRLSRSSSTPEIRFVSAPIRDQIHYAVCNSLQNPSFGHISLILSRKVTCSSDVGRRRVLTRAIGTTQIMGTWRLASTVTRCIAAWPRSAAAARAMRPQSARASRN